MWYVAAVGDEHGISMNDIALGNLKKLNGRYKQGKFSQEESKNRTEYKTKAFERIKDDLLKVKKEMDLEKTKKLYVNMKNPKETYLLSDQEVEDKKMMRGPLKYKGPLVPVNSDPRMLSAKRALDKAKSKIKASKKVDCGH